MIHRILPRSLCLTVLLLSAPLPARAADAPPAAVDTSSSPYATNRIDALHHRPAAMTWLVDIDALVSPRNTSETFPATLTSAAQSPSSWSRTTAAALRLGVTFAVTNDLAFSIVDSPGFALITTFPDAKSSASTFRADAGPSSPTFAVDYRAVGALKDTLFIDTGLHYTPSLGGTELSAPGSTGNRVSPFHTLRGSARLLAVAGSAEVAASLGITHNFSGSFHSTTPGGSYTSAPFTTGALSLLGRFHFLDSLFASVWAGINFGNSIDYTATAGSAEMAPTLQTAPYIPLGAELGWRVTGRLLLTLGYSHVSMQRVAPLPEGASSLGMLGYAPSPWHVNYFGNTVDLGVRMGW